MSNKDIAIDNAILRGVVGSTAHGTALEGTDDRDEMGVFIEPSKNVCGLTPCEHYIYRDQPEGVRSQAGDLDLTLYSLRKFCRLAAQGNPSVVILLWLPDHITKTVMGQNLINMREAFISRNSGQRFLGYLVAQKQKMKGERAHTVNRPELVAAHGYDTKFAMHALRLGYEGIEMLTDGCITLPIPEPRLGILRAIRLGGVTESEALMLIEDAERKLRALVEKCTRVTATDDINEFMVMAHQHHWMGGDMELQTT